MAGVPKIWEMSPTVTHSAKYYSPWVRARQEQLEQDLKRAQDPVALMETKSTLEVHGKNGRYN
jgi:hypothetical protein